MLYGNVVAAVLTFSVSVFGLGAEYRWQPVDAAGVGAFWIDDQEANPGTPSEIVLTGVLGSEADVTLHLHLSGWGDADGNPELATYQTTVNGLVSYASGDGADLVPKGGVGDSAGGFVDTVYPDWVFAELMEPCSPIPAVNVISINYQLGASILGTCTIPDEGLVYYGATLILAVPTDAAGTYTIDFVESLTNTFMNDGSGAKIHPLTLTPALITIPKGRCCYNFDTGPQCAGGITETECAGLNAQASDPTDYYFVRDQTCTGLNACISCQNDSDCDDSSDLCYTEDDCNLEHHQCEYTLLFDETLDCCDPDTGALIVIDDGIECTLDICDPATGTVTHPPAPAGTECGSPPVYGCDAQDTCNGAGACVDNLAPEGTECGDPPSGDCDAQDTCDGAGTCVDNFAPAGTECGNPPADECDLPDACNDSGVCIDLFALEGTPCDHEIECIINDQCDGTGKCVGDLPSELPTPCDDDSNCPPEWFCDTSTRVPGLCDCNLPCSSFANLLGTFPPNCAIDARQPHEVDTAIPPLGWDELVLMFDHCDPAGLGVTMGDFQTSTDPDEVPRPWVNNLVSDKVAGTLTLRLNRIISAGIWTCIEHGASGSKWCMGYLPGDAGQDRSSTADDIQDLLDSINGADVKPEYATDANRSSLTDAKDILRLIDLLNGADTFGNTGGPWLGKSLRRCAD